MKISKQEQLLLSIIAILLLGLGYYQFAFKPQQIKNQSLTQEKVALEQQLQEYEATVASLESKKIEQQRLALEVSQMTTGYYQQLDQEQIILDLNKLLIDHQLTSKLDFTHETVAGVVVNPTEGAQNQTSSLQQYIDQYQGDEQGGTPVLETEDSTTTDSSVDSGTEVATTTTTVEQMSISLAVEGDYKKVQQFIKALETYEKRIIITESQIKALAENNVTAALKLELYAIPNLETEAAIWGLTGDYGKDIPFSNLGSAFTQTLITADENKRDFIGIIKSSYSDLSSFMLAKANDEQKLSYLIDDTNGTIEATMRFSQVDGQYVYSQTVGDQSYPTKGQQEAFVPQSNYIIVELTSEAIIDSRDTTKLALKIENKTDKTVVVFIRNDDEQAPRIQIEGQSETVVVVKQ